MLWFTLVIYQCSIIFMQPNVPKGSTNQKLTLPQTKFTFPN